MPPSICKDCGKSKSNTRAGSLTSFFFQHNFCQCNLAIAKSKDSGKAGGSQRQQAEAKREAVTSVCKNCGKSRPEKKRAGSFTSFLFQELRCTCPGVDDRRQNEHNQTINETRTPAATRASQRRQFTKMRLLNNTNTSSNTESLNSPSSQTVLQPGDSIGGFLIKSQIGLGGMGVVYLVEHMGLRRQFALKVLAPDLVNEQNWLRFQSEAKTMASLNHQTFVKVYDLGIHARSVPFYSMDYLDGDTLETLLITSGPFALDKAIDIFLVVLDGLAYAHRNGIIHRDLKPANIMLCTESGAKQIKVLDFGISKFVGSDVRKIQSLTAAGDIFGSPYYMSPEQCNGETVDARSDIYSIGCSLFEVLSGFVPFDGNNSVQVVAMHQDDEPAKLTEIAPELGLPPSVDIVIAKCLAKQPQDRYQSAKELAIDLQRIKEGKDLSVYSDTYSASDNKTLAPEKLIIAAAALITLIAAAGILLIQGEVFKTKKQDSANTAAKITSNSSSISTVELLNEELEEQRPTLTPARENEISEYIKTTTEPFSTTKIIGNKKIKVFNFPKTFSIGALSYTAANTHEWTKGLAKGVVTATYESAIHIGGSDILASFPQLLKFFRPDEIDYLRVNDSPCKTDTYLPLLLTQQKLYGLELKRTLLSDSDIPLLSKLKKIRCLDTGATAVTSAGLAKLKQLPQITALRISFIPSATEVLRELAQSQKIAELDLSNAGLNHEDFALLAKMKNLRSLTIKQTDIDDKDLAKLTALQFLETLYLDRCYRLTAATTNTMKKFKALKKFRPPDESGNAVNENELQRALPELEFL